MQPMAHGFAISGRTSPKGRKKLKTSLFEAYGTVMKEYVAVADKLLTKTKELKKYLELSYSYAQTLKPKPTKKTK